MSKLNQIQNKLLELDGGTFQKLADSYLRKKGYEQVNPLGSVLGTNKVRKGTPDTLIPLPSGKFVFAEYTTQRERVFRKISRDLENCFDEAKTGVPVDRIEEVVFCHLSLLEPNEEDKLRQTCQQRGVNLNIFGIGPISYDLLEKFPGLGRDYLGVEIDTGQILSPEHFVATYNKNKLATRLDTTFYFREDEVEHALQEIENSDLVIVYGRPGVGKSRLALESCHRFGNVHPEYELRCIFNRGPDIFEDLRVHFSESGHFLILVDDANRISQFDYVVQLLQDQREDQRIKVIATVRDYALDKIRDLIRPYGHASEICLQHMEEKQIKEMVEGEYGIRNGLYLDRIANISQGNPRLAIMAAEIAAHENNLASINDVSALYDKYFAAIRQDLGNFPDRNLLKVAGIIVFFRVVDRSNDVLMDAIKKVFGISPEPFWEATRRLNTLEILDVYEDEVVKVSDQVLATYLFYLACFREGVLNFSSLLRHFFPNYRQRLVDAVFPALDAFDTAAIIEQIQPHLDRIWRSFEEDEEDEKLLHLMEVFGFIKQTDSLFYIRKRIEEMEKEPLSLDDIEFKPNSTIPSPSLLGVLRTFERTDEKTFRIALKLLFEYLAKQPRILSRVIYLLSDYFGIRRTSYARGFRVQQAVVDVLWEQTQEGSNELFSKLFVAVSVQYLQTRFQYLEAKGGFTYSLITLELSPSPYILELRQTILDRVIHLYKQPSIRQEVLGLLYSYSNSADVSQHEMIAQDAAILLPFIDSELDPDEFRHCLIVQEWIKLLDRNAVDVSDELRKRFRNETYVVAQLLLDRWDRGKYLQLGYDEFQKLRKKQRKQHFRAFDIKAYDRFFHQCQEIQLTLDQDHEQYELQGGVTDVLLILADTNPDLCSEVLKHYLLLGDPLQLNSSILVSRLIQLFGSERTYHILSNPQYSTKRRWLFSYYRFLRQEDIRLGHLEHLYTLYSDAKLWELPFDLDFLLKYRSVDNRVVVRVTEMIMANAEREPNYASALEMLFHSGTEANKLLTELFADDLRLLKRAYLSTSSIRPHFDYDRQTFSQILDLDPQFISEFIIHLYDDKTWYTRNDSGDYTLLWMRDDYLELMIEAVETLYQREPSKSFTVSLIDTFFSLKTGNKHESEILARQDQLLTALINRWHNDCEYMIAIFSIIADFTPDRRRQFFAEFLKHNSNFEDFERLPLEPSVWSWSGSAVPMLQGRVTFFESLLPMLNTVDLLQHKQKIERQIQDLRAQIEEEKKRDFIDD